MQERSQVDKGKRKGGIEVNIEQLNAIPGRPDGMEWIEAPGGQRLQGDNLSFSGITDGVLDIYIVPHDNARTLYDFANYIRRVEIELERMNAPEYFVAEDGEKTFDDEAEAIDEYITNGYFSTGDEIGVKVDVWKATPVSALVSLQSILERACECLYGSGDFDENDEVVADDAAEEALNVWADTHLRYSRGFPCNWHAGSKTVKVRVLDEDGKWEVVE